MIPSSRKSAFTNLPLYIFLHSGHFSGISWNSENSGAPLCHELAPLEGRLRDPSGPCSPLPCRGRLHPPAVRRAAGVVGPAVARVPELPHADGVAAQGAPAPGHHPELRQGQGERPRATVLVPQPLHPGSGTPPPLVGVHCHLQLPKDLITDTLVTCCLHA